MILSWMLDGCWHWAAGAGVPGLVSGRGNPGFGPGFSALGLSWTGLNGVRIQAFLGAVLGLCC